MRNNKAILDEAAASVRRTFIGSVAGSVGMLAVVGAAGAYGMPEKLTAQALSAAMTKFNMKFPSQAEQVEPVPPRPVVVAQSIVARSQVQVSDVMPSDVVVRPVTPPEPAAAPRAVMEIPATAAVTAGPAPAVTVTASLMPRALPDNAGERPLLSAPMVFEAPKETDAQVLSELPKTEEAAAPAAPVAETPKPAPVQRASLLAEPPREDYPRSVMIALPLPKPPLSPAQRLELQGKEYDKAEKCLAQAIYFEARNEPARGQQAVAQVVLNRVFSPYYPKDVCSVVYQNAHRHLSCQFTFACDGKPEAISERGAWSRASRIAKQTLSAQVWLPEVNKATHYHAAYVRPNWVRDMNVMVRYGLHTFYRPRNWGDGAEEAHWGTAANSVKSASTAAKPLTPAQRRFSYRKT